MESGEGSDDPLHGLHKGRGVRGNLGRSLFGSKLGDVWRIEKSDVELIQRAKVIYRLDAVFNQLAGAEQREALPFLYNTPADPQMALLDYRDRMKLMQRRYPNKAYSSRTLHRIRTNFAAHVGALLERTFPPFNNEILGKVVDREEVFAVELTRSVHPQHFTVLVQRGYDAPMGEPIAAFLKLHVVVPRTRDGGLLVGRTARHGLWTCAFSTEDKLLAHPVAKRQEEYGGCHNVVVGADLVREVVGKRRTVGIVVDPSAVHSSNGGASNPTALHMSAETLRALLGTS